MKLTHSTDLALRVLMYLGFRNGQRSTLEATASILAVSENHLVKVVINLSQGGYVRTIRGRGGGIELANDPQTIFIGDVVRHMEPDFKLVECLQQGPQACVLSPACELKPLLGEAMEAFFEALNSKTLADLLAQRRRLQTILAA